VPVKRIKSTWHHSGRNETRDKTFDDIASALAFILWRVALEGAKDLHREQYDYRSDQQRAAVIAEFLAFLVQVSDRLVYERLDDEDRATLINFLGLRLADHMQDNLVDLFGPGDYRPSFIATLNERLEDYSGFNFRAEEPGYDFLRYFGDRVLRVMGTDQTNKWVIDQIMDQAGPDAVKHVRKALPNLLGEHDTRRAS
jgi:hypothetical protein